MRSPQRTASDNGPQGWPIRLFRLYCSVQFMTYVLCGVAASATHLIARWVLSFYVNFPAAVFLSYFVGMPVAFLLYRYFVFSGTGSRREWVLFALSYFGFLPVTWSLSVACSPLFQTFVSVEAAHWLAHLVGVVVPVLLNFAYNKFVTFKKRSGHYALSNRQAK